MHLILTKTNFQKVLLENCINIFCIIIVLFLLGKILNNKTRFVDILNTALIYRLPIYLASVFAYILLPKSFLEKTLGKIENQDNIFDNSTEIITTGLFAFLILLLVTYAIVLLVYGFKTATNTKKWHHFVLFGLFILIAEGLSKYLIAQL